MMNSRSIRNEIVETGDFRKLKMNKAIHVPNGQRRYELKEDK